MDKLLDTGILKVVDDQDAGIYRIRLAQGHKVVLEYRDNRDRLIQVEVEGHPLHLTTEPVNGTRSQTRNEDLPWQGAQWFVTT